MVYCCVPFCKSSSRNKKAAGFTFHEFPVESEVREAWLKRISRKDFQINSNSPSSVVCSLHFVTDDYRSGLKVKRLKNGTVPSVFHNYPKYMVPHISQPRPVNRKSKTASNEASKVQPRPVNGKCKTASNKVSKVQPRPVNGKCETASNEASKVKSARTKFLPGTTTDNSMFMNGVTQSDSGLTGPDSLNNEVNDKDDGNKKNDNNCDELLCRLCAKPDNNCLPIFTDEGNVLELKMKISKYLPVQLHEGDRLPHRICLFCLSAINAWDEYAETCRAAEETLKRLFCSETEDAVSETSELHNNDPLSEEVESSFNSNERELQKDRDISSSGLAEKRQENCDVHENSNVLKNASSFLNACTEELGCDLREVSVTSCEEESVSKMKSPENLDSSANKGNVDSAANKGNVDSAANKGNLDSAANKGNVDSAANKGNVDSAANKGNVDSALNKGNVDSALNKGNVDSALNKGNVDSAPNKGNVDSAPNKGNVDSAANKENVDIPSVINSFPCKICDKVFSNVQDLLNHKKNFHALKIFKCKLTPSLFKKYSSKTHKNIKQNFKLLVSNMLVQCLRKPNKNLRCNHKKCITYQIQKHGLQAHESQSDRKISVVKEVGERTLKTLEIEPKNKIDNEINEETALRSSEEIQNYQSYIVNRKEKQRHMQKPNDKGRHNTVCPVCKKYITKSLRRHLLSHEEYCITCNTIFANVEECIQHKKIHLVKYLCELCGRIFKRDKQLTEHLCVPVPQSVKCHICDKICTSQATLNRHVQMKHMQQSTVCEICGKKYNCVTSLKVHLKYSHSDVVYKCDYCSKEFKRKCLLSLHIQCCHIQVSEKTEQCEMCGKKLKHKSSLRKHLKRCQLSVKMVRVGNSILYEDMKCNIQCEVCGKIVKSKLGLAGHMKTHTKALPVMKTCPICGLVTKHLRRHHVRVHIAIRLHKCRFCDKRFSNKRAKGNHERSNHTGERPFVCSICNRGYFSKSALDSHCTIHLSYNSFECEYCGRGFKTRDTRCHHRQRCSFKLLAETSN